MELEKELSELVMKTRESEEKMRELFRFCCPPSLRKICEEFCYEWSYGGTVFLDDEKRVRQQFDWKSHIQICVIGNYDVMPTYIFHMRYFGGNFAFAPRYTYTCGGSRLYRQDSKGFWYPLTGQANVEEELQQCVASLGAETLVRFLQEGLSAFERAEADLWQFMRERVKACGSDAEYLFSQTHHWLSSQREFLARGNILREEKDLLRKQMHRVQNELREIVERIGASKSFVKSKALRALRERGEKFLHEFSTV